MYESEDCTRAMIRIDDENYYLVVGDAFVMCTVPRENDPAMSQSRIMVETICREITRIMEFRNTEKNVEDDVQATIGA